MLLPRSPVEIGWFVFRGLRRENAPRGLTVGCNLLAGRIESQFENK